VAVDDTGMRCVGCPIATFHSVDEACDEHRADAAAFLSKLRDTAKATA
jgi:hybrid cluster-associated redox disulfide protein